MTNADVNVVRRDAHRHTYEDYLVWSSSVGSELVDGVAYVREPPSPGRIHQEIVGGLYRQVAQALEGKPYRAYVAPFDVRLPKSVEPDGEVDTVVQPDVFIVSDLNKVDDRGVRGAPDWIVEVLSPSTARHDQIVKLPAYERAGVREVWIVHPADRTLAIYRLEEGRYGRPVIVELRARTALVAVPGVGIDWDAILEKL